MIEEDDTDNDWDKVEVIKDFLEKQNITDPELLKYLGPYSEPLKQTTDASLTQQKVSSIGTNMSSVRGH